jgi:hypothetical protein
VSLNDWIPPTISDLDADGRPDVVVVELTSSDSSGAPPEPRYQVVMVHGQDGGELWRWGSESDREVWHVYSGERKGLLMRPRLLRAGDKDRKVAVLLPGNNGSIVVLGPDGAAQLGKANHETSRAGIWTCDADGDGADELIFLRQTSLCVARADSLDQPLWTQPLGYEGQHRIFARGTHEPPVVAVARDGTDNSVLGFDTATGERVWFCPGAIWRSDGVYMIPRQIALLDQQAAAPHVYYSYNEVSRCRQALPPPTREAESVAGVSSAISVALDRRAGRVSRRTSETPLATMIVGRGACRGSSTKFRANWFSCIFFGRWSSPHCSWCFRSDVSRGW